VSRLVGVVLLAVVPSAQAAIGIQLDQNVVVVGASLHVTAFGPAGTAGMPVYLAPASIDFTTHPCDANSICGPTSDNPPSAPCVRIGHVPKTIDIFRSTLLGRCGCIRQGNAYGQVIFERSSRPVDRALETAVVAALVRRLHLGWASVPE